MVQLQKNSVLDHYSLDKTSDKSPEHNNFMNSVLNHYSLDKTSDKSPECNNFTGILQLALQFKST